MTLTAACVRFTFPILRSLDVFKFAYEIHMLFFNVVQ